jgi:YD repeat-containing protein
MSNCRGCGNVLAPTESEVNQGVTEILEASLQDAVEHGEICPLCGHSKAEPISHRKSVQFSLLLAAVLVGCGLIMAHRTHRNTERQGAAQEALKQIESNPQMKELLGVPVTIEGKVMGTVKQDETGWHEFHLTIPVHGSKATGVVRISGGRESGPWRFTTLQIAVPQLKMKADLLTGRIVEYSPDAYEEVHTEAFSVPEYVLTNIPAASWDGNFPCVSATAEGESSPKIGNCATPMPMSRSSREVVDRFETDLRHGNFTLRQTDLVVSEGGFSMPLTRAYAAQDWAPLNKNHAFGMNANHQYDIAPVGTRNPYTEQFIVLENGDFLYFRRISNGSGYADAIYRHLETGSSFYKATQQWNGNGWTTKLQDGSTITFPESYNANNLAQGAATQMTDTGGNKIELHRDRKRNLQEVLGPTGGSIKFSYDDGGRILHAEDNQGNWTAYKYNSDGFLTDVVHSTGRSRYYYYENGLLTWIRDEKGHLLLHNFYNSTWLVGQTYGNGQTIHYHYDLAKNGVYAERVAVTLPDGSLKSINTLDSVSYVYKRMK